LRLERVVVFSALTSAVVALGACAAYSPRGNGGTSDAGVPAASHPHAPRPVPSGFGDNGTGDDGTAVPTEAVDAAHPTRMHADGGTDAARDDAGGNDESSSDHRDAATDTGNGCSESPARGDLAIVELMVATDSTSTAILEGRAPAPDRGEWIEIQSTSLTCAFDLFGVQIGTDRTEATGKTLLIRSHAILGPGASFVVADSALAALNGGLPGLVFAWVTEDALADDGGSIFVRTAHATVDALAYPGWTLEIGRSVSFPADCAWADRQFWERWSWSARRFAWAASLVEEGTPNAANTDVRCY
jgi:hypothetical protein